MKFIEREKQEDYQEKAHNQSKICPLDNFSIKKSNLFFVRKKETMDLMRQDFAGRVRLNTLYLPERQCGRFITKKIEQSFDLLRFIKNPTAECELCGEGLI